DPTQSCASDDEGWANETGPTLIQCTRTPPHRRQTDQRIVAILRPTHHVARCVLALAASLLPNALASRFSVAWLGSSLSWQTGSRKVSVTDEGVALQTMRRARLAG